MPLWECLVTIVEHERLALIEADTKSEALALLKSKQWRELGDARCFTVRKSGKLVPASLEDWEGGSR